MAMAQHYVKSQEIGRGGFGSVYKGKDILTGEDVAIKVLFYNGEPQRRDDALREVRTLIKLDHPNILRYRNAFEFFNQQGIPTRVEIVTDYCSNGSLSNYLRSNPKVIPRDDRLTMFTQLMSALSYMHGRGITHRDIKPDNILVNKQICVNKQSGVNEQLQLKIADVGLAKELITDNMKSNDMAVIYMQTQCGTVYYKAPEVFQGHYSNISDIFSMGLVMYVICELPPDLIPGVFVNNLLSSLGIYMLLKMQQGGPIKMALDFMGAMKCEPYEKDIINDMLKPEYNNRPSANEILQRLQAQQLQDLQQKFWNLQLQTQQKHIQQGPYNITMLHNVVT